MVLLAPVLNSCRILRAPRSDNCAWIQWEQMVSFKKCQGDPLNQLPTPTISHRNFAFFTKIRKRVSDSAGPVLLLWEMKSLKQRHFSSEGALQGTASFVPSHDLPKDRFQRRGLLANMFFLI